MINIFEEKVKSRDTLRQTFLNCFPFLACDNAWQKIIRPDAFRSLTISIHGECDALIHERHVCCLLTLLECVQGHFEQAVIKLFVCWMWLAINTEHLIICPVERVMREWWRQCRASRGIR